MDDATIQEPGTQTPEAPTEPAAETQQAVSVMPKKTALAMTAACAVITLCIGGGIGYGVAAGVFGSKLDTANGKIKTLETSIGAYRTTAEEAQAELENYEDTVGSIEDAQSTLDEITSQVDSAQGQLDSLTGKIEDARKDTITTGVWVVGQDIEAGTYKVTEAVPDDCYWEISTGEGGFDIIDNDLPGGGFPQVTLTDGQHFKSQSCGVWARQ